PSLTVQDVPENLRVERLTSTNPVPCLLCSTPASSGDLMPLWKMRSHVGRHILCALRGIEESIESQASDEPCGFCGRDEVCKTILTVNKNGVRKISSSCRYHYEGMVYAAATKSTTNTPSTNVPIHCPLCPSL
ncbi:hypothetical protein FKP32DRAFT_1544788, partial [Trametes sanguinea]